MSIEKNIQVVKDFLETIYKALDRSDKQDVLALVADDIEWIIPGKDWPLAGTHRGHAEMVAVVQKASETVEASIEPSDYIAQGDRVMVVGVATGKIKATNKTFKDEWVFDITVRDGKVARIQEYIDTQALARAAQKGASELAA
jgi:ketosteroid isomerase-like protein